MIDPMITDVIAATSTVPAAASFTNFAVGWYSGCISSTIRSIILFRISRIRTSAITNSMIVHSIIDICKIKLTTITIIVAIIWIRKLRSWIKISLNPFHAWLKPIVFFLSFKTKLTKNLILPWKHFFLIFYIHMIIS